MIKICSWNIFMRDYDYKKRIKLICDELRKEKPDIICLQEVIPAFFDIIQNEMSEYTSAFIHPYENNTTARAYGEVILSKIPIISKGFNKINSEQGRVNSWIEVCINNKTIRINTGHLESTESFTQYILKKTKNIRREQLLSIKEMNADCNHWIWIGDTNLLEDEEHEMYNSSINTYFSRRFNRKENAQTYAHSYDKVWLNNINLEQFYTISGEINNICLSDHDCICVYCYYN